jgi:hypothetical protein
LKISTFYENNIISVELAKLLKYCCANQWNWSNGFRIKPKDGVGTTTTTLATSKMTKDFILPLTITQNSHNSQTIESHTTFTQTKMRKGKKKKKP